MCLSDVLLSSFTVGRGQRGPGVEVGRLSLVSSLRLNLNYPVLEGFRDWISLVLCIILLTTTKLGDLNPTRLTSLSISLFGETPSL